MTFETKIQEVFGQFAVDLGEGPVLYKSESEAITALAAYENGAEQRGLAADFCANQGIEAGSKNAKGKENVIVAFLSWVEAGKPGPQPVAVVAEVTQDEAQTTVF